MTSNQGLILLDQDGMTEHSVFLRSQQTSANKSRAAGWFFHTVSVMIFLIFACVADASNHNNRSVVYLAGSGNVTLDQHILGLLEQRLDEQKDVVLISDEQTVFTDDAPIVAIGADAFSRTHQANRKAPVLALLVEKGFLEDYTAQLPGQVSGIFKGTPLIRQALTGKAILPQSKRIALIATPDTTERYDSLLKQLPEYNLEARLFVVGDKKQLIPTLSRALGYGDFLLAAPDDSIYNPTTIKHVLLTAYRQNRIVIGPSRAYVKAGALASGYASVPAMAEMAVEYLQVFFKTGKFPEPDYPSNFHIDINQQVGRSLNIPLAPGEQIEQTVSERLNPEPGDQ